jgi:hypothetical protein
MAESIDGARLIAVFDSIHYVLAAERVFRQHDLWYDLVPTPRQVSSDCGMVLEFRESDAEATKPVFSDPRVRQRGVFRRTVDGFEPVAL